MNRQEALYHFEETFIKTKEKNFEELLQKNLNNHRIEIENIFKDALRNLMQQLKLCSNQKCYYMECSFLLSNALIEKPCFSIEAYGKDWYFESISKTIFEIDFFTNPWNEFRIDAKKEIKKYFGIISESEGDQYMLCWFLNYAHRLIPFFQLALEFIEEQKNIRVYFGEYRGLNELIAKE